MVVFLIPFHIYANTYFHLLTPCPTLLTCFFFFYNFYQEHPIFTSIYLHINTNLRKAFPQNDTSTTMFWCGHNTLLCSVTIPLPILSSIHPSIHPSKPGQSVTGQHEEQTTMHRHTQSATVFCFWMHQILQLPS